MYNHNDKQFDTKLYVVGSYPDHLVGYDSASGGYAYLTGVQNSHKTDKVVDVLPIVKDAERLLNRPKVFKLILQEVDMSVELADYNNLEEFVNKLTDDQRKHLKQML